MNTPNLADKLYGTWEKQTAEYFDKVLRNPGFLELSGNVMGAALRSKIMMDGFLMATWKSLLLPTKRDQERTLHLLNELHSRVNDLEDELTDQAAARDQKRGHVRDDLQDLSARVDHLTGLVEQLVAHEGLATEKPARRPAKGKAARG
ncbi:MAG: hypothetical protein ABIJ09_07455 [Pseudomonadota bacterium]